MKEFDCEHALDLEARRVGGFALSPDEERALSAHLEACRDCGVFATAFSEGADEEGSGALPVLDELSRRRAIDTILAGADQSPDALPAGPEIAPRRRRGLALAAAALAAAAALVLFVLEFAGGTANRPSQVTSPAIAAVKRLEGRVMLVSGDAGLAGAPSRPGDFIASGAVLSTNSGSLVAEIVGDIGISLEASTSARVGKGRDGFIEIGLERGSIQISVRPGYAGPGIRVLCEQGSVEVTGTVFSVSTRPEQMSVAVLRGRVHVKSRGGVDRSLIAGQRLAVPQERLEPLDPDDESAMWSRLRVLDLLDARGAHAQIEIASNPPGAQVSLDGIEVGETPVTAAVRSGHRLLELDSGGHAMVNESLTVDPDARITRFYNLEKVATDGTEAECAPRADTGGGHERWGARPPVQAPAPAASADEMLVRARSLRAARDWVGAERAYVDLIRAFPEKAEVRASVVALGEIQLGKLGKPSDALRQFDRYLDTDPNGVLAQEAQYGKVRALRAMGRGKEERAALSDFVDRFPGAMQVPEAKRRLAELDAILELSSAPR